MKKEYILLKDVILPKGTKFSTAPTELGTRQHIEAFFPLGKNFTGTALISLNGIEDADENIITEII